MTCHNFATWTERLKGEQSAFWKFDDMQRKGVLLNSGAGTLGRGIMGSTKLGEMSQSGIGTMTGTALFKTQSMPVMGPTPPCGQRVGEDCGMSEVGSSPPTPALRRRPRFAPELEDRLQFLESTFTASSGQPRGSRRQQGGYAADVAVFDDDGASSFRGSNATSRRSAGGSSFRTLGDSGRGGGGADSLRSYGSSRGDVGPPRSAASGSAWSQRS
eukprot:TRINITY_DN9710_c0_g1_i1.p1 TRINITY_DN9710_c0_g1~~TRINITY_DN9710_c0_g1_i1.p1  ORF type:complete len:215 (-),score=38.21 TRINITY_DN9710_c0_g1_i1:41-685(-)